MMNELPLDDSSPSAGMRGTAVDSVPERQCETPQASRSKSSSVKGPDSTVACLPRLPPGREAPAAGPVRASMKTVSRVNMARKDSDNTDEFGMDETVDILIPPRPPKAEPSPERSKLKLRKGPDIQRYFQSTRNQDFQIACDDTATVGERGSVQDALQAERPSPNFRRPLEPLSESALNRMQGELEAAGSQSSADEVEVLRPHHPPGGDLDALFSQRGQSVVAVDEQGERDRRSALSPRAIPSARSLVPRHLPSSPRTNRPNPFPTPPSSGPPRGERLGVALRANGGRQPRQTLARRNQARDGPSHSAISSTAESPGARALDFNFSGLLPAGREEGWNLFNSVSNMGSPLSVPVRG